jgi:hypothetical protein
VKFLAGTLLCVLAASAAVDVHAEDIFDRIALAPRAEPALERTDVITDSGDEDQQRDHPDDKGRWTTDVDEADPLRSSMWSDQEPRHESPPVPGILSTRAVDTDANSRLHQRVVAGESHSFEDLSTKPPKSVQTSWPEVSPNAYGLGVNSTETGAPHRYRTEQGEALPGFFTPEVKRDAYGLGVHMDQFGRPVRDSQ